MSAWKKAGKVALWCVALLALAIGAVGVYILASIVHTVEYGNEETQKKAAAETLSCEPSDIEITGSRAVGCGKECVLETTGSSASWWSGYRCIAAPPPAPAR